MSESMKFSTDAKDIWEAPWPMDGLEALNNCPICGDSQRKNLYDGLVDNTFFCAPGKWSLWSCISCSVAYLDPRPSPATISLAYEKYYTHTKDNISQSSYEDLRKFRKLRRRLVNGYTNWRFGTKEENANALGVIIALLIPFVRKPIDNRYRNLPKRDKNGSRLLDLGCGNGTFLKTARNCGWDVVGVDPDPKAVREAQDNGFEVHHGSIDIFAGQKDLFDFICMNHVIEHLHDPIKTLADCHRILKPGGTIWIETPNIDSFGCQYFGINWRGLETPRHLVIQSSKSLAFSLKKSGFYAISWLRDKNVYRGMFKKSYEMSKDCSPNESLPLPIKFACRAYKAKYLGLFFVGRREFLIITARKPKT